MGLVAGGLESVRLRSLWAFLSLASKLVKVASRYATEASAISSIPLLIPKHSEPLTALALALAINRSP